MPLTADRAKPAVPFGGIYRLIDFALSNVVNSGYLKVVVLTQYKSHSLDRHVTKTWRMSTMLGNYVAPIPAQQRIGKSLVPGQRRRDLPELQHDHRREARHRRGGRRRPRVPDGLLADGRAARRVRRRGDGRRHPAADRDVRPVRRHRRRARRPDAGSARSSRSRPTPTACPTPRRDPRQHGQLRVRRRRAHRCRARGRDARRLASTTWAATSCRPSSSRARPYAYDFKNNVIPGGTERDMGYWRDVGTMDSYFDAHMDLVSIHPVFNLYNYDWPIYTDYGPYPPAKFVHGHHGRFGEALNSAVSPGVVISGATDQRLGRLPRRARAQLHRGRQQRAPRRRADRPELPHPAGDHRQERHRSPRRPRSGSTASTTGRAASRSPSPGITVVGKGQVVTP